MKKILYPIIAAIVIVFVATSCEHKELCYDHTHAVDLQVVFDWKNAPSAAPASMSLYLFPQTGGEVLRYEFTDPNGGTVRAPIGNYDALCINSDVETIQYMNTEQKQTFEVTTRQASLLSGLSTLGMQSDSVPRARGTENERIALAPDMLYSDHAENIGLIQTPVTQTITLYPDVMVSRFQVEIRNAANLKYVSGVSGSLSSMAGGLLLGVDEVTTECVTIPFDAIVSADKTSITGVLQAFGHCPSGQNTHQLTIYAILSDGSKWYYTFDVTLQIHSAPDPRNVHIVLDGLPLPKPIVNGGGFRPVVDGWRAIDVNVKM